MRVLFGSRCNAENEDFCDAQHLKWLAAIDEKPAFSGRRADPARPGVAAGLGVHELRRRILELQACTFAGPVLPSCSSTDKLCRLSRPINR